jgi:hypothetical protein
MKIQTIYASANIKNISSQDSRKIGMQQKTNLNGTQFLSLV